MHRAFGAESSPERRALRAESCQLNHRSSRIARGYVTNTLRLLVEISQSNRTSHTACRKPFLKTSLSRPEINRINQLRILHTSRMANHRILRVPLRKAPITVQAPNIIAPGKSSPNPRASRVENCRMPCAPLRKSPYPRNITMPRNRSPTLHGPCVEHHQMLRASGQEIIKLAHRAWKSPNSRHGPPQISRSHSIAPNVILEFLTPCVKLNFRHDYSKSHSPQVPKHRMLWAPR